MTQEFELFQKAIQKLSPQTAIVLGSGLANAVKNYRIDTECKFTQVPGLGATSVHGHAGKVSVGFWGTQPAMVFHGRLHYYEGKTWETVTSTVALAAQANVKKIVLTNAAGGIHNELNPGDLMAIRGYLSWLNASDFRRSAEIFPNQCTPKFFDEQWTGKLMAYESQKGRKLISGIYAGLTGPCYETPAEIRALKAIGADAVGMSTVKEAERATQLGITVVGISCITNKAAGISAGPLDHKEVLQNAAAPAERIGELVQFIVDN